MMMAFAVFYAALALFNLTLFFYLDEPVCWINLALAPVCLAAAAYYFRAHRRRKGAGG